MSKILVTGSKGQLGSEIEKRSKKYSNLNFSFIDIDDIDLTNKQDIQDFCKYHKFDWIINCAAYTAVDKAETERELAEKVNVQAVNNLVEAAKLNSSTIIHISTDFVYDGKKSFPYIETDSPNPLSFYGDTKLKGEEILTKFYDKYFIIRTSWLYSSFGNNFVKTIIRLANEKEELKIISDQIGTPTYSGDLVTAIFALINRSMQYKTVKLYGLYHFSNEGVASWYDFAKAIVEIKDINCKIYPIGTQDYPTPAVRPKYSVLNKKKIKDTFGINIPYWRDSLKKCIEILEGNEVLNS